MELEHTADVLVVGAGPVGMTAAILLASHGVRVCVVEKNATTADDPKAISLDDESLRVYQRAGIADRVLGVIVPGTGTLYHAADGRPLFHGGAPVPFRFGFPFKNPFAQPDLERVLLSALKDHPLVDLRFSTELVSFSESNGIVSADVLSTAGPEVVTASYILGADGGRSRVRSLLGVSMSGRSYDDVWLVIDCTDDEHNERFGLHYGDPRRPHVIVPGLHGRCRYEFYLRPEEALATPEPSFDVIRELLSPFRPIEPEQVERAVAYRFHGLIADEWKSGRAFLLGDAAHMMPPFAGQGLNSGIRDAANLTWKIAAVLRGESSASLLDTYTTERRPHAAAVVRSSERLGRVVMTTNERLARFRDAVVRRSLQTETGRAFFEGMQYRPSPRITDGLVIDVNSNPLVGLAIGQPLVFDFTKHCVSFFDDILGAGWSVLGVNLPAGATGWGAVVDAFRFLRPTYVDIQLDERVIDRSAEVSIAIDLDGRLRAEVSPANGQFIVVRPDRVVAAVCAEASVDAVAYQLEQILAPQRLAEAAKS